MAVCAAVIRWVSVDEVPPQHLTVMWRDPYSTSFIAHVPPRGSQTELLLERRRYVGEDSDVIHDHSTAGPPQAAQLQAPTAVTAHGVVSGELGDYYRALGDTVHMVAISRAQQWQAPDIPWSGHVCNALRLSEYPFRAGKGDRLLFLGRSAAAKGVHLAIDAARQAGLPITVAGRYNDPAEQPYIEIEIRPRLGQDVRWIGEVDHRTKVELLTQWHAARPWWRCAAVLSRRSSRTA